VGARVQVKRLNGGNLREAMSAPEAFRANEGDKTLMENDELRFSLLPHELLIFDYHPGAH
jgi:hypothetical protein